MAFRDLLLHLSSYPEASPAGAIDRALGLAEFLGARLSALTFEVDFFVPGSVLANAVLDVPGMIAAERDKSVNNARTLLDSFRTAASRRGVAHDVIIEKALEAEFPKLVTECARLYDLALLPIWDGAGAQRYIAESVIFGSGRPVLALPAAAERAAPVRLDRIGIAWDFSRPAARAVGDAIPLLQRAKSVRAVTFRNEKAIETRRSGAELARHLDVHGVAVAIDEEDVAGRSIGTALESYCADRQLDVLVMGAYGHSRMRDFILGGATKSILGNPPVPVLLSH